MAGLTASGKGALLSGFTASATYASLHTADPGSDGSSEVTGGSPAYARKAITWGSPSNGSVSSSGNLAFDVPGSTTITHIGYWSADTAGTFLGSRALDTNQTFATQGTYTITSGNLSESVA
jgi:hypothetical protein